MLQFFCQFLRSKYTGISRAYNDNLFFPSLLSQLSRYFSNNSGKKINKVFILIYVSLFFYTVRKSEK